MTQSFELAAAHIAALTGSPNTPIQWRCIHDTDGGIPAHKYYGTLAENWNILCDYNNKGWGIFYNAQAMDGQGHFLSNVEYIRAHVVDLDNPLNSHDGYQRAVGSTPMPSFGVQTSPNKFHLYWLIEPYVGNDYYSTLQRKLAQVYNGDSSVIDAARVLRMSGFHHLKDPTKPSLVTCWNIGGPRINVAQLAAPYEHVQVFEGSGTRKPLGETSLAAPSIEWLLKSLELVDPNDLSYSDWMSFTAAYKQAGWTLMSEQELYNQWFAWCSRYEKNSEGDCIKLWNSLRDTELGWKSILRRVPSIHASITFGHKTPPATIENVQQTTVLNDHSNEVETTNLPEILDAVDCQVYFKNCFFVARTGEIFNNGRFLNANKFNGKFGGKHFIITTTGKTTDEAWKAALRSTVWNVPKVDHVRFLPDVPTYQIITDKLGRKGLNTYIKPTIKTRKGDISPFLNHMAKILPDPNDQRIIFEFMAHNLKFPGYKIFWAPMIQSAEGIGKTVFFKIMDNVLGDMYVYKPKAPELVKSGSTFNGWMRCKTMIMVDEIKIDERRELIEILKPMITDDRVEVQSKGVDQEMEDNLANWWFFSNYKDAIPVTQNGRRYAIFFSALQSKADIFAAGMDDAYFNTFWAWCENGGYEIIADWFLNYPIEKGQISRRAPETSSYAEAVRITRSPAEVVLADAVADNLEGFRGGYISLLASLRLLRSAGIRNPSTRTVQTVLEHMGYIELGRANRAFLREDPQARTTVYALRSNMTVEGFGAAQGYPD